MSVFGTAYLLRYLFAAIIVIVAVRLLISAIKELRWAMKHSLRPAQGYFLLNNQGEGDTLSLPLYHTTNIGRSGSNDIRIHSDEVSRRHAVIYRFDGDWYIRPQNSKSAVSVNGEKITGQKKLTNRDKISFGPSFFVFVDERAVAKSQGEVYEEAIFDDDAFYRAVDKNSRPPYMEWVLVNVFMILATAVLTFMLPETLNYRKDFLVYTLGALLLMDIYFLLLPKIARYADRVLYLAAMQLSVIGVAIQARLALIGSNAYREAVEAGNLLDMQEIGKALITNYRTQLLALLIGLALLWLIVLIVSRTRLLENLAMVSAIVTPLLLIATLVFGRFSGGAVLWISIGGFSLQLTEFAKITFLIALASFFKNRPPLRVQIYFAVWAAVVFFLLLLLPDLGSIMILLPVTLLVFVVMTSEYLKTFLIFVSAGLMSVVAYGLFGHVRARIAGWTSIWTEVNDQNRQVVYGLQAVARGNVFGRGLGNGSPNGIPLAKSDMIFNIICEEFGILVAISVVVIILVILLRSIRTTVLARDGFTSGLALALGAALFVESFVVIGGTTGLIPLTGVTLPFIAQGGSSLMAKWFTVAILLGLASRHEEGASKK